MSHILTLEVPEEVYKVLMKTAEQTGQPPEALAVQWLAAMAQHLVDDPLEQFIGAFSSHGSDWAEHHDTYLGRSITETMRSAEREGHAEL